MRKNILTLEDLKLPGLRLNWGRFWQHFNMLIKHHGSDVIWHKHIYCFCINSTLGNIPDVNCSFCKGSGRLYPPDHTEQVRVLLLSYTKDRRLLETMGATELGSVIAIWDSRYRPNIYDKVSMINALVPLLDITKYKNEPIKLRFTCNKVEIVMVKTTTNDLLELKEFKDFTFEESSNSIIITNPEVKPTYTISVRYLGSPYYYVTRIVPEYRGNIAKFKYPEEFWVDLPTKTLLIRGDLL